MFAWAPAHAFASPRQWALEQFPSEVRTALGKKISEVLLAVKDVPPNKRREDERALFLNLLGINYDVTLGKKGEKVGWMALRSPPQRAAGLYEKLLSQHGQRAKVKEVQVAGPAPGHYIEMDFPQDGVQFRFVVASKDLYSVVVRAKP